MKEFQKLCHGIASIAAETGRYITSEAELFKRGAAERKGVNDFVTHVDLGAEKMLVERLGNLLPGSGFITEEKTTSVRGDLYNWIIDPLDGTTNFIHGVHPYAISIGLTMGNEIIAGVVHEASGSETFSAWKGGGAWLNGKRIFVSDAVEPSQCLIATGFPYKDFSRAGRYLSCLEWMLKNTQGVRRMGSASIDLAYVACGRFELFFEYGLNPWDVAAGIIIVREAGGITSDFRMDTENHSGSEIIATNKMLHATMGEIIGNFMN